MITIKEVQIKFPKWWQIALIIAVIIIVIKVDAKQASKLLEQAMMKWLSG